MEIYEGDILEGEDGEETGIVEYYEEEAMFIVRIDNVAYDFSQIDLHYGEVIGNIHDNQVTSK